ncbi:MAG: ABC transporter ATP-binding protein [Canibacter sp.]
MNTTACTIEQVTKTFSAPHSPSGKLHAVRDVSFSIKPGEIVALLGPNGAGKTTLIDMILGLTQPTSGTVKAFHESPTAAVNKSLVGAVLQTGGLLPDLTVLDTIRMVASTFPQHRNIDEVLEETNLVSLARRRVKRCSGGEQQRLRHALAILGSPDLLILDEPTSGMDPNARRDFWASMQIQAERGTTIIFATHYLEEAQNFAERIVLMNLGTVVADGSVDEVQRQATATRVSAVVPGDLSVNSLPNGISHIERHGDRTTFVTSDSDSLARFLLTETSSTDVTITRASLDDAFTALTAEPSEATSDAAVSAS